MVTIQVSHIKLRGRSALIIFTVLWCHMYNRLSKGFIWMEKYFYAVDLIHKDQLNVCAVSKEITFIQKVHSLITCFVSDKSSGYMKKGRDILGKTAFPVTYMSLFDSARYAELPNTRSTF